MRTKTSDFLRQTLERDIEHGRLHPGARVDEQSLAARFSVSRTPVRETLLQMAALGLLRFVPRGGAVVNDISIQSAIAMIEVLSSLEAQAAELAARRMDDRQRRHLAHIHKASKKAASQGDVVAYIDGNTQFHAAIYDGARNSYLTETIRVTRLRLNHTSRASLRQPGRLMQSWNEHDRICGAIVSGDAQNAHETMTTHVTMGGKAFADVASINISEKPQRVTKRRS